MKKLSLILLITSIGLHAAGAADAADPEVGACRRCNAATSMSDLPPELLKYILRGLSPQDLIRGQRVSPNWRSVIQETRVYETTPLPRELLTLNDDGTFKYQDALARFAEIYPNLAVDLGVNYLGNNPPALFTLLTALPAANLKELNLSWNNLDRLSDDAMAALRDVLARFTNLTSIDLLANNLGDKLLAVLPALPAASLKELNLRFNNLNLSDDDMAALMTNLGRLTSLKKLDLRYNLISIAQQADLRQTLSATLPACSVVF
jgi:hypothetical protein